MQPAQLPAAVAAPALTRRRKEGPQGRIGAWGSFRAYDLSKELPYLPGSRNRCQIPAARHQRSTAVPR